MDVTCLARSRLGPQYPVQLRQYIYYAPRYLSILLEYESLIRRPPSPCQKGFLLD